MRLTLRTLLAYLDDILEPADAHELGEKIGESEFASGLVHRIRSVTRKLRLGAPKLTGKGMGLDANTVAEYLDNTLSQDRVPDFEKVCLESDVQLAEVASCHQILTLVLGEPADVDPAMQDRLRALSLSGEVASSYAERLEPETSGVAAPPVARSSKPPKPEEVPLVSAPVNVDQSGFRLLPIIATLAVAFLLALVALLAMGPLNQNHPIVGSFFQDETVASSEGTGPDSTTTDALRDNLPPPSRDVPADSAQPATAVDSPDAADETPPTPPAGDATGSRQPETGLPALPEGVDSTTSLPGNTAVPGQAEPETTDDAGGRPEDRMTPSDQPPPDPAPSSDATDTPAADTAGDAAAGEPSATDAGAATDAPATAEEDLGRYTSDQQVAARFDPETGDWLRLPGLSTLAAGDRILVLPTYRPQFLIAPGLQLVLVGPAELTLQAPDAAGVPGLDIRYGKAIVVTDGKSGSHLNLQLGKRVSQVTFVDTDSMLAVNVSRYLPPGSDPETWEAYILSQVYAVNGQLEWKDQGSPDAVLIEPGQLAGLVDQEPAIVAAAAAPPDWLDSRSMSLIDRDASKQLEPKLSLDRPLTVSLQEQVTNRLVEVRTLAVRSLGQLGEFDSFVDALNDSDFVGASCSIGSSKLGPDDRRERPTVHHS